jgi:hypothetical protein
MDLIFTYNYLSFFNLLNFLKQMIILFLDFYNLAISLNVDDFDYLEILMKYFASLNFLILMKQSWTMLTNVTNKHIKV